MNKVFLLGNEAVALGAAHAGITGAYAYPGTPSTEILQFLIAHRQRHGAPLAEWATNEKVAYEQALGMTLVGKRALVAMKHVGLNVAADPFMSSALVSVHGGLVLAIADDPGMHSSQNEQDSRFYADFARIPCLEPATHQEAYDMAREAFDLSEKLRVPVMIRLVTRLAHARGTIEMRETRPENELQKAPVASSWILMPVNARRQWHDHVVRQQDINQYSESTAFNRLTLSEDSRGIGVITTGLAVEYYRESRGELGFEPSHLHIGAYPFPVDKIRTLAERVQKLYILEDGYSHVERLLRGIIPPKGLEILGKESGHLPVEGELTPDLVRTLFGLPARASRVSPVPLPDRPPQLCPGCPHTDTYVAMKEALGNIEASLVTSDVGCYTLGALPPHNAIETCVCMGASVGLAKGAVDAGFRPVVAVIGDSTFLHSGLTPLLDAVRADSNMTLIILDNLTVAMTGGQPTAHPSSELRNVVAGLGVNPEHLHLITAHRKFHAENSQLIRKEVQHEGLSVIIAVRECIHTVRRGKEVATEENV